MAIYSILYEDDYDITNGHSSYYIIKQSTNQETIFEFYNSVVNKKKYPDMFIERYVQGHTARWDDEEQTWI